jgi:hypothetical protein
MKQLLACDPERLIENEIATFVRSDLGEFFDGTERSDF